jgi:site-specific recombinase XerD
MTRDTDLGVQLRMFLGDYLPNQRRSSPGTVRAYRDALKLLLRHASASTGRSVAELRITNLDRTMVLTFLESIETTRGNGVTTRNQRLAAIRSFFRFVSSNLPDAVEQCAQIVAVPQKRGESRAIDYLTTDEVRALLASVSVDAREGRRDDLLLRFLYNTGARVQEAVDVRPCDLQLDSPAHVLLRGKGRKERLCPLWPDTVQRVNAVLRDAALDPASTQPLFMNRDGEKLTRFGVRYILAKYVEAASRQCPSLEKKNIHPHTMRHTTAMHLLQSGVDLNTIRCWLGHASVTTTNRYVEIDLEMKRQALGAMALPPRGRRPAIPDAELLTWLESL